MNYNGMIKKMTSLLILQFIMIVSYSQTNSAFLNKAQKNVYSDNLTAKNITGYIEFKYPSYKDLEKDEPSHYTILYLDSLGNTLKTIEYDKNKKRGVYTIFQYDDIGQLSKKYNYKADNTILWIDEYLYDISGELVETIQIGESGTINSKTLNYYNNNGFLNKSEVIGPDGNLTFTRLIKLNSKGLPTDVELKHTRGFTMSTDKIKYNENDLPREKIMTIEMTGKTSKFTYKYNKDNLLLEQSSYVEDEFESIEMTQYFTGNFLNYLSENGFDYENLSGATVTSTEKKYYLKTLAQYPNGEVALKKYLQDNITDHISTKDKGVVIIGFAVDIDGSITDIEIHRSVSKRSDKQAVRIIKGMPNWIPAEKSDGSFYKSTVSISIPFL